MVLPTMTFSMWHTKDVDILMLISPLANPNYHLVLTPLIIYSSLKCTAENDP